MKTFRIEGQFFAKDINEAIVILAHHFVRLLHTDIDEDTFMGELSVKKVE